MKRLLFCCLLILSLSSQRSLAEVFVVTSTLASGDGSLRDALEKAAANGRSGTDTIRFNITRARDIIINIPINNLLPALSDDLVIDGTTQPGDVLGVSDAKVCIAMEGFYTGSDLLYIFDGRLAKNVQVYGLFLKGKVINPGTGGRPQQFYGILLQGSQSFIIGKPSKGNVISGFSAGIFDEFDDRFGKSLSISVSSNIFGLDTDGVSRTFNDRTGGNADNVLGVVFKGNSNFFVIGGATAADGNLFHSTGTDITVSGQKMNDATTTISNNRFGLDINGNNLPSSSVAAISVSSINTFPAFPGIAANPVITNNYIAGRTRGAGILLTDIETNFLVDNNLVGFEDSRGEPDRDAAYGRGIFIRNCMQGTIRENTIRYWQLGAIIMDAIFSIRITNNSTYCNKKRAIELRNWNTLNPPQRLQPYVYINRIDTRGTVSGSSLPNNTIEIFYNEKCETCEGKTLIASVNSDAAGNWMYNGSLTGDNITATATEIFFSTSEYSMPKIDTSALVVSPVTCEGGFGAICGLKILSGTKWRWEDESGAIVGYDTCLRLVPAGRYFLKISIGSSCEESFGFTIRDVSPAIDVTNATISSARCGRNNGSICGIRLTNAVSWRWEDENGTVVSTASCFNTARPGRYRLRAEGQQGCFVYSPFFEVPDKVPAVDETNAVVIQPSCGRDNGSVTGLLFSNIEFASGAWYNEAGILVSNTPDLRNAAPGRYKYVIRDTGAGCGDSTIYFTLNRVPEMIMNAAGVIVNDASCGNNNGSIRGITFTNVAGILNLQWTDPQGRIISTANDLSNAGPGTYRLKAKDGSNCDTLFSAWFTVIDRGSVSIDTSALKINATDCNKVSGGITGLRVSGADTYQWINSSTGAIVGSASELLNVPAGSYQLTARNLAWGCTAITRVYVVPVATPMNIDVLTAVTADATCGNNNGSIQLSQFNGDASIFTFKWLKDSLTSAGTGTSISGLAPAKYFCIATDSNGCEVAFYNRTIVALPMPQLDVSNVKIIADTCEMNTGRIDGIVATSDIAGLAYTWRTATGQAVGTTPQLRNSTAGTYILVIKDARGCEVRSGDMTVPAISVSLPAPRYTQLINIPRNSNVTLQPLDNRNGNFELKDAANGIVLDANASGRFLLQNVGSDRELSVRYNSGPCTSSETIITIKVFDETRITVPNAFSPNNDGVNDVFKLRVEGYFRMNYLRIFNRYGQMIHESRDPDLGWDGKRNGTPLPLGTYYWLLDGIDMNNKRVFRSGSITLIR